MFLTGFMIQALGKNFRKMEQNFSKKKQNSRQSIRIRASCQTVKFFLHGSWCPQQFVHILSIALLPAVHIGHYRSCPKGSQSEYRLLGKQSSVSYRVHYVPNSWSMLYPLHCSKDLVHKGQSIRIRAPRQTVQCFLHDSWRSQYLVYNMSIELF